MRRLTALLALLLLAACAASGPARYKGPIGDNASASSEKGSGQRDAGDALVVGSLSLPSAPDQHDTLWVLALFQPYDPNTLQLLPGRPFALLREPCTRSNGVTCDWTAPQPYAVATPPGAYIMTSLVRVREGGFHSDRKTYLLYPRQPAGAAISVAQSTAPRVQVVAGQATDIGDIQLLSVQASNYSQVAFRVRRDSAAAQAALSRAGVGGEPLVWQPAQGPGESAPGLPLCGDQQAAAPIPFGC